MNHYRNYFPVFVFLLIALLAFPSYSGEQKAVDSSGYRKSDEENFANVVVLQGLNKITAHSSTMEIPVNSSVKFGNLEIRLESCWKSAPDEKPESAALLQVWEQKPGEEKKQIFFGWMFSSTPSISTIEHSVYDLTVLECKKAG